jgi:Uma2 family endonuclease
MSTASPPRLMTLAEFLDLPDRGKERMLIRGELWERKMTVRNPWHSSLVARITILLGIWARQVKAVGEIVSGDAGFRLAKNPDSFVGVDVAYVAKDTPLYRQGKKVVFDGPPILAVEVLSPSDQQADIDAKIDEYLAANVPLIWIVNPHRQTVTVYRPDAELQVFLPSSTLTAEPHLPGFAVSVAELFADLPSPAV